VEQYRQDAQALLDSVADLSLDDLKTVLLERSGDRAVPLKDALVSIAERHRFKYSRAFAIGLYTLVAQVSEELLKDKDKLMDLFRSVADSLSISFDKLQKDVELYRSNLDKMVQAKAVMADILAADRKKREERAQAQSASKSAQSAAGDSAKDAEAVATPSQDSSTDDSTTP
jgi:photosystem II biogenesis protein Psp29